MPATRLHLRRASLLALCLSAAVAAIGCPGELDDPERFVTECPDIKGGLFAGSCIGSGCHNAADLAGGLDLASPRVEARLIGVAASPACGGTLVDPANPTASVLYRKLTASYCGPARMPAGGQPLTATELECVRSWIAGLTTTSSSSSSSSSSGEL